MLVENKSPLISSFKCWVKLNCKNLNNMQHGVAIRSGHHCTQPLHRYLGLNASARASLHFYNTKEDVDDFIHALTDTINFFLSFK